MENELLATFDQRLDAFRRDLLKQIESGAISLPSLPDVIFKIRTAVSDANASAASVAAVISRDTAISARLLKVANSVLMRGRGAEVNTVEGAVTRLGLTPVQTLVTGLAILQGIRPLKGLLNEHMKQIQTRSLEVAAIAWAVAHMTNCCSREQAMLAGLIHDIGYLPALQLASRSPQFQSDPSIMDRELHELHPEIGAQILERWLLPVELVEAVLVHEDRYWQSTRAAGLGEVLVVANVIQSRRHRRAAGETVMNEKIPAAIKLFIGDVDEFTQSVEYVESMTEAMASLGI